MTRTYRHWTFLFRWISRVVSHWTLDPLERLAIIIGLIKKPQKTILWTKDHTWNPVVVPSPTIAPSNLNASPSIELSDYSGPSRPHPDTHMHDTPAMAHSLFPPAITTRRPRNESDASLIPPTSMSSTRPRTSDDSSAPLIQRPSDTYHHRHDTEPRTSAEARRSLEDAYSPSSPQGDSAVTGGWLSPEITLHSRQAYRRANSDATIPPLTSVVEEVQRGLGIRMDERDLERGER